MQFHEKKIDLFDFTCFFAWNFLNFHPTVNSVDSHPHHIGAVNSAKTKKMLASITYYKSTLA